MVVEASGRSPPSSQSLAKCFAQQQSLSDEGFEWAGGLESHLPAEILGPSVRSERSFKSAVPDAADRAIRLESRR